MASPSPELGRVRDGSVNASAGYRHELGIYRSDEEFRSLITPFALDGVEAGEPVVFAYDPHKVQLLQHWFPETPAISYVTDTAPYAAPAKALLAWRQLVEEYLAAGAHRVRIAGDVPHPGYGQPYAGWDRYEAAIDRAWNDLPVWAPCLYDARVAPPEVIDRAMRLHRHRLDVDGAALPNDSYVPVTRLDDFLKPAPDPLEQTAPSLELVNPTPALMRAAIRNMAGGQITAEQSEDLLLATSEAVTNAYRHGRSPVTARIWLGQDRIVVKVHDQGDGPLDPFVGLLPRARADGESGRGLWLTHLLNIEVALIASKGGFTVRLVAAAR